MSKLDQALARARQGNVAPLPAVPEATAGAEPQFAVEEEAFADAPSDPVPAAAAAPTMASVREVPERPVERTPIDVIAEPVREKLAPSSHDPSSTEQYRRIATRLHLARGTSDLKVVMVTSAVPGEGKTLTATNVALTLSESYRQQVLLVDADLRRPGVHQLLGIPNVDGLNGMPDSSVPLLRLTEHLTVLTAGQPDHNPMTILSSGRMRSVLEQARASFQWVIVDTPPVALLTDAHLLSGLVDTVLLVVRAGSTPLPAINTAVSCIGRDRIFGVVLNRADEAHAYAPYDESYYYSAPKAEQAAAR